MNRHSNRIPLLGVFFLVAIIVVYAMVAEDVSWPLLLLLSVGAFILWASAGMLGRRYYKRRHEDELAGALAFPTWLWVLTLGGVSFMGQAGGHDPGHGSSMADWHGDGGGSSDIGGWGGDGGSTGS